MSAGKPPSESFTEMTEVVLPSDGNALGTAFGGRVMAWIDVCAAVAAQRHCRRVVVTASMDELHFHAPIRVGSIASLRGRVNAVFRRSLEVEVEVHSENPLTGERRRCCSALLTFTALDEHGRPTEVIPLQLESEDDRIREAAAQARRKARLEHKASSAAGRGEP